MIFAIYDFTPFKDELPKFNLKELLNIEDLNSSIFNEVFNILKPHQQEQYIIFKKSEEAKKYREDRNARLPLVDFKNLPETLDPTPRFMGNVGEPDTVTSYIIKYGVNPLTREPETIESFQKNYTIDPKTGDPVPRKKNE